ncbi:putative bifunctional diguanylate cyclase/phosphodiesterase [Azohydromonas aeria]|uniref:putative bifunctional diguanylate cyclase/phosphodiesterase n=1 Tax=Azohydromonas aeria TaxID=2590212 RepID=UPI0018E064A3|nr:EAL domain-containing protein [Azohydromonas aeria]
METAAHRQPGPEPGPPLPVAFWHVDAAGRLLHYAALPGQAELLLVPGPIAGLLTPAWRLLWELTIWPALQSAGALDEVVLDLRTDGESVQVLSYWRAAPGAGPGDTPGFEVLAVPGAQRARLLGRLRRTQETLDAMPGALLQVCRDGDDGLAFPWAGGQLLDLLGVSANQAMAHAPLLLDSLVPANRQRLQEALAQAERDGTQRWAVVLQPRRWPQRRIELAAQRGTPAGPWHCVLTDVTDRERLLAALARRASTDELTSLPNRSGLLAHLAARLRARQPFAVLFMDCDRFKQINDSLGHDVGDQLLQLVARRLRRSLRPSDLVGTVDAGHEAHDGHDGPDGDVGASVAARLGGDEFVVIADGVRSAAEVGALADRLVRTMGEPYQVGAHELVLGISMGVVLADALSQPEGLLRDSDTAMYEAKRGGRNRWVLFEPAMQQRVAQAMTLEMRLRHALAAGQVRPVFQPVVALDTGRIVGLEALARWHDPVLGAVSPARFIPVAEDSGQIGVLGEQVLRSACAAFMHWRSQGLAQGLTLSVNLSRAQLRDPALPRRVAQLLGELGMPHEALQLEVTESLALSDDGSLEVLARLRALGCRLSLDDFGTAHSSLAALHRLPVQQVKLDRGFVAEIESSPYHRAVVQAALQVARALALEVVAEGVETAAQAQALAALGCERAQGWFYARPVEPGAVPSLLLGAAPETPGAA